MARNGFGRTVVRTTIYCDYFDADNNEHQNEAVKVWGDYDLEHAQKAAQKALGVKRLLARKVEHSSYYGYISYADFDKVCEKSNEKEY